MTSLTGSCYAEDVRNMRRFNIRLRRRVILIRVSTHGSNQSELFVGDDKTGTNLL